jgi:hypothetical protein
MTDNTTPAEQDQSLMQTVQVTLSNGVVGNFCGPAITKPGDMVHVTDIAFTVPRPLPPGTKFAAIE